MNHWAIGKGGAKDWKTPSTPWRRTHYQVKHHSTEPETVEDVVGESERRSVSPENQYKRSIYGLPVNVVVSIGRKKLSVAELLKLRPDTIIPLTAKIEDPIELLVDDRLIAHGELIELEDGAIGVRLTQIEEQEDG